MRMILLRSTEFGRICPFFRPNCDFDKRLPTHHAAFSHGQDPYATWVPLATGRKSDAIESNGLPCAVLFAWPRLRRGGGGLVQGESDQ